MRCTAEELVIFLNEILIVCDVVSVRKNDGHLHACIMSFLNLKVLYVVLFVSQLMTRTENENRSFIHLLSSVIRKRGCVFSENVNVFGRSIAKTT